VIVKLSYNSECLSNKCFVKINTNDSSNSTSLGYCMFNSYTPIVHCDSIYKALTVFSGYKSYMYCGKAYRDQCNTDAECSSERCYHGVFQMGSNQMPSDSVSVGIIIRIFLIFGVPVIFIYLLLVLLLLLCRLKIL